MDKKLHVHAHKIIGRNYSYVPEIRGMVTKIANEVIVRKIPITLWLVISYPYNNLK